jgi:hypothetical protein
VACPYGAAVIDDLVDHEELEDDDDSETEVNAHTVARRNEIAEPTVVERLYFLSELIIISPYLMNFHYFAITILNFKNQTSNL